MNKDIVLFNLSTIIYTKRIYGKYLKYNVFDKN